MDTEMGPALDDRYLEELSARIRNSDFHRWAGLDLIQVRGGRAELGMDLQPHHLNPQGLVHGGVITAIADSAIGLALRSQLRPGLTHRTAQLNVHFLAKGEGGRLVGKGRSLHLGQRMGYGEAEVVDPGGRVLARASGTFIILPAPGAF